MRVSELSGRLGDSTSLQEDVSSVLTPQIAVSEEPPRAAMRLAAVEVRFPKEQQAVSRARQEVGERALKHLAPTNACAATRATSADPESVKAAGAALGSNIRPFVRSDRVG